MRGDAARRRGGRAAKQTPRDRDEGDGRSESDAGEGAVGVEAVADGAANDGGGADNSSAAPVVITLIGLANSGKSSLANALSSGGCLSATGLMGVLETPSELKQFASQLSPHLGLTPHAMLDFLATDDVISQIDGGAGGITSPLRSARQELGKELNNEQRLEAAAAAEAGKK